MRLMMGWERGWGRMGEDDGQGRRSEDGVMIGWGEEDAT
jgi:hypothetical protein